MSPSVANDPRREEKDNSRALTVGDVALIIDVSSTVDVKLILFCSYTGPHSSAATPIEASLLCNHHNPAPHFFSSYRHFVGGRCSQTDDTFEQVRSDENKET